MKQDVRFCTSHDGVRLAYAITGKGPLLVRAPHFFSHLERDWHPPFGHWFHMLAGRYSLLRFDQRGTGLSDRDATEISFDAWLRDLECVVDAAGLERFALFGPSQGGPVAIAYAARHPERVTKLLLFGSYARGWAKRGLPVEEVAKSETHIRLVELGWTGDDSSFRQVFSAQFAPDAELATTRALNALMPQTASAAVAARVFREIGSIDVQADAQRVRCPALVMHARGDIRVPFEEGRRIAGLIPDARLVVFESRNHLLVDSEPSWGPFVDAIADFYPGAARPGGAFPALTPREREVLELIAQGLDNAQIAARLELSEKTVRNHITQVFEKMAVENRSQAIVRAREQGLGQQSRSG